MDARPVIVVTGASAGVGRAVARMYGERGAAVGLIARGTAGLAGAAEDVRAAGGVALELPTDVADHEQVYAAAERVEAELGPIDVWVNNAMTTYFGTFESMTDEEFRRVTEVTYLGVAYGTRAALTRMKKRNSGRIIQVGSSLAYRGIPLQSAYCGSKHAIQGLTDSLRAELLHDKSKVSVSMVQLPAMNTPQFRITRSSMPRKAQPVPPIYQPEVGAQAVLKAARQGRREYWVAPITAATIIGDKIAPGLLDRYLAATNFDAQQVDEPETRPRPDNLYSPVPGDHGAHGVFDEQSKPATTTLSLPGIPRPVATIATSLVLSAGTAVSTLRKARK